MVLTEAFVPTVRSKLYVVCNVDSLDLYYIWCNGTDVSPSVRYFPDSVVSPILQTPLYLRAALHNGRIPGTFHFGYKSKGKGRAILVQAWSGPYGSRRLRLPDLMTVGV
jgi:hypothetical protein